MRVDFDLGEEHLDGVLALFREAWWTKARTRRDVVSLLAATDVTVGLVDDAGTLVAVARALTDRTHRAVVLDVIVKDDRRGGGLGRQIMDALLAHPKIRDVECVALWCKPERVPFYERLGFATGLHDMRLMLRGDVSGE